MTAEHGSANTSTKGITGTTIIALFFHTEELKIYKDHLHTVSEETKLTCGQCDITKLSCGHCVKYHMITMVVHS